MDMLVSERLLLMVQVILICPANVDAFTTTFEATTASDSITTTPTDPATTTFETTTGTESQSTTTTTTTIAQRTTTFESTASSASESTTPTSAATTAGTTSFTTTPSFGVTTATSEGQPTTNPTSRASTTMTSESRATTEEFITPSTVNICNSTVVTCEKSTEIEAVEAKLAVATALAAVFGATSAILLVLLLVLQRGAIVLKWRDLCSKRSPERRNRNQLQMDGLVNTNSHIYTDLRIDSQGENPGSPGSDVPFYVNAGEASGDRVYANTRGSMGTFRP